MNKKVPESLYDEKYYLGTGGCEGVELFLSSKGKQLSQRLSTVLKEINEYKNKKILELGCGRGEISLHLEEDAESIDCVDYSKDACKIASSILKKAKVHCTDATEFLPTLNQTFDIIIMNDFLEHLFDWQVRIVTTEIDRLTTTNSVVYINIPIIPNVIPSTMHVNIPPTIQSVAQFFPNFDLIKSMVSDAAGGDKLLIFKRR